MKKSSFLGFLAYYLSCSPFLKSKGAVGGATDVADESDSTGKKKYGGWKCMPYIIGNETFERVATMGLTANFSIYLVQKFHMSEVAAAQASNVFGGTMNFAPIVGAFVSDAYWGRFRTLAYSSIATFLGMIVLTMTAVVHQLQPPKCSADQVQAGTCPGASVVQIGVLIVSLALLTIGGGGVRPCSLPFGVDQFDKTTDEGKKGLNSYFNWYYCTSTAGTFVALTVIVWIQSEKSWAIGFGIPTFLMLISIVFFFTGTRYYEYVSPEGSVFSGIAQVFVASFKKRSLQLPAANDVLEQESLLYNPTCRSDRITKLPLTLQFKGLNKAAIKCQGEVAEDGSIAKPWRLCTIQQVEEVKCLLRIIPLWASGIICFVAMSQQWTFSVFQSFTMDRHLGKHFEIPPATIGTISLIALSLFIPLYDQLIVPVAKKITGIESGITLLQRQGTGLVISAMSMVVAGLVEEKRRNSANAHNGNTPMSAVMWLAPQLSIMGIAEAFNAVGQIEFYNRQFPEHMQTLAGSLFYCSLAGASYLSTILVALVQKNTNWLKDNKINNGKLDYFYYMIAVMGAVNFIYFLVCAHFYHYKGAPQVEYAAPPPPPSGDETNGDAKDHQNV